MDMTEGITVSEMLEQQPSNGNGRIHMLQQREDAYQAAYEAGLASGKEVGYRRGYRDGFSDCYKLANPAPSAAASPGKSTSVSGASKKTAENRASRLRGLPCANCGCSSFSDEVQCPRCGTPKIAAVGDQSSAVEASQSRSLPNRRTRRRP
jgi:hypothetical protein